MKNYLSAYHCTCGHEHTVTIDEVFIGNGTVNKIPECLKRYNAHRPFLLADVHTRDAGNAVYGVLREQGIEWNEYVYPDEHLEPDERAIGAAFAHFDCRCDIIIAIGSGVINDIEKILSNVSGRKYIIVATAPSMDGYASTTSSMAINGVKVSLDSHPADVIIGDIDILKTAPVHMIRSGLGDMMAKYVSIAEWRISHLLNGVYYCGAVAQLIRDAVKRCIDQKDAIETREDAAIYAVFEGLILGGFAMSYAGSSLPASGVEHYFSHIWDMRGLEFGTKVELHGIQCAIGTLYAARLYDRVRKIRPDREKTLKYVQEFCYEDWCKQLRVFLGNGAETMIALEKKEGKYDKVAHAARLTRIEENWEQILKIIDEELPSSETILSLLHTIGIPDSPECFGVDPVASAMTFKVTKDIRDKYILSKLAWDMGILEELSTVIITDYFAKCTSGRSRSDPDCFE